MRHLIVAAVMLIFALIAVGLIALILEGVAERPPSSEEYVPPSLGHPTDRGPQPPKSPSSVPVAPVSDD